MPLPLGIVRGDIRQTGKVARSISSIDQNQAVCQLVQVVRATRQRTSEFFSGICNDAAHCLQGVALVKSCSQLLAKPIHSFFLERESTTASCQDGSWSTGPGLRLPGAGVVDFYGSGGLAGGFVLARTGVEAFVESLSGEAIHAIGRAGFGRRHGIARLLDPLVHYTS